MKLNFFFYSILYLLVLASCNRPISTPKEKSDQNHVLQVLELESLHLQIYNTEVEAQRDLLDNWIEFSKKMEKIEQIKEKIEQITENLKV